MHSPSARRKAENAMMAKTFSERSILERTENCDEYFDLVKPAALENGKKLRKDFAIAFSHLVHKEIGILEVFLAEFYRLVNALK